MDGVNSLWLLVDRLLAERLIGGSGGSGEEASGSSNSSGPSTSEFLVKWREQGYDASTWEAEADLVPKFAAEIAKFRATG